MQFGSSPLPVPVGHVGSYGVTALPIHATLLQALSQQILTNCNAQWVNLFPADGYVVKYNFGYDVTHWFTSTSAEFPVVALFPVDEQNVRYTIGTPAVQRTWKLFYAIGNRDKAEFARSNGLIPAVSNAANSYLSSLDGETLESWGLVEIKNYKAKYLTATTQTSGTVLPYLEATFQTVEPLEPSDSDLGTSHDFDPRYLLVSPVQDGVILFNNTTWVEIPTDP